MLKDLLINHLAPGEIDRTGERVDGKATIIGKLGYNWIAVLDAKYRQTKPLYYGSGNRINHRKHAVAFPDTTPAYGSLTSAAEIMSTDPLDPLTSGQGTYADGLDSVLWYSSAYCSSIAIAGTTAAFPNIQTLAFIYLRRAFIDSSDPTLSANPTKGLVNYWGMDSGYAGSGSPRAETPHLFVISTAGMLASLESGSSLYPAVYPILEIPAYEDRTGERIDNKATIIGKLGENWIAVLDAAYRGTAQYSVNNKMEITGGLPYTSGDYTVTATSTENYILAQTLYDSHSSKWNTCYLNQVQTATSFPAAKMCYDINVGGNHAQLPNAQALAFVYSKKDYIDAKDPTASTNPDKKLSNWGFGSSSGYLAASTNGAGLTYCVAMNASGNLHSSFSSYRTGVYGVCPILEIPLYKDRTGERVDGKATIAGKLGNYWIAVLDAAYRSTSLAWGSSTDIFNITISGTNYSFPYSAGEAAFLNTAQLRNDNTSRDLTNINISTRPAALFCRDTILAGFQCSLPNIQTMSFVRSWKTWLDSQDPTVSENQGASLSNSNLNIWTSSPESNSATKAYLVGTNIAMSTTRTSQHGVCPILEIPLWCDDDYK